MLTYEQRNEPIGPFLSCSMCIYIRRKMHSGQVQNGLDQSRIWTARPDMLSRFFDLDSHVPLSGPDLDQIWNKSGIRQNHLDQFWQPPTMFLHFVPLDGVEYFSGICWWERYVFVFLCFQKTSLWTWPCIDP